MKEFIKTKFLDAKKTCEALQKHIESCNKIYWAVAWATKNDLLEPLFSNPKKIEMLAFGISFSQTDPDVLLRLIGLSGCGIIQTSSNETFHPKLYLFEYEQTSVAIIGSANFTKAGLSKNTEFCVEMSGPSDHKVFVKLKKKMLLWKKEIYSVTEGFVDRYRISYLAARKRMPSQKPGIWFGNDDSIPPLISMNWDDFVTRVREENIKNHDPFKERMLVLTKAQRYFSEVTSFGDLNENRRKAIAGTFRPKEYEKAERETGNRNWGWFGGMSGNGKFSSAICAKDSRLPNPKLVAALDKIPLQGNVERSDFETYVREITSNVPGLDIGTLTRLLAIKRPDTFICICSGNRSKLARGLGITQSKLNELDGYWQNVIERFRSADWYNASRPSGENGLLWDRRAAMADAVYYG